MVIHLDLNEHLDLSDVCLLVNLKIDTRKINVWK